MISANYVDGLELRIKELTLSNQNLNTALQKVSDYNLRLEESNKSFVSALQKAEAYNVQLENDRDAWVAQVYRMAEFIRLSAKKWEGVPEVEPTFWNLLRVVNEAPQQCLAEIKAEAVLKFAGTILVKYRYDITEWAKEYADKIRQGGEK